MDFYTENRNKYIHLLDETNCFEEGCQNDSVYLDVRLDENDDFMFASGECQGHRNHNCPKYPCACTDLIIVKEINDQEVIIWHHAEQQPQIVRYDDMIIENDEEEIN
jgi:hypothetical protein